MPKTVDVAERRRAIARAAMAVARPSDLRAVTYRSVAAEMGTSTTAVTHYAATRGDLINLLFDEAIGKKLRIFERVLRAAPPRAGLALLIELVLPLRRESRLIARLYFEAIAEAQHHQGLRTTLANHDAWFRHELERLVDRLGIEHPANLAADLIAATLDGIATAALAEPDDWPSTRQRRVIYELAKLLGIKPLRRPRRIAPPE